MYQECVTQINRWRVTAEKLRANAEEQNDTTLLRAAEEYERIAEHTEHMLAKYGVSVKVA